MLASVVALVMCTDAEAPGARSPNGHASVWFGAEPVIEHVPGPEYAGSIDQLTPPPLGSGSDRVADRAIPVPAALLLATLIVKPIGSPAVTCAASATFVIDSAGGWTTTIASSWTGGWLSAVAVAMLSYVPPLAAVVVLVMWTEFDAPGAMSPNAQFSVWLGAEPEIEHVP